MPSAPVVIVGAGAAGLSAAAALQRRHIDAVVLEQDAEIARVWARRYDRLHLHTVRELSSLAYFSIPSKYPRYLSRDDVVAYLREYARHFQLNIVTNTRVVRISQPELGPDTEKILDSDIEWTIATTDDTWQTPVVVVATGQFREPVVPHWEGREGYAGVFMHSSDYRNATPFAGRRVLVVGTGNSGAEIATDLADGGASFVAVSMRTVPPIVPRDPFGWPVQRTSQILSRLPVNMANRIGRTTARLTLGDLSPYGLAATEFAPYTSGRVPLIDVGFVDAVKRGRVALRPAVEGLTATGASFARGASEAFDAIVAATGFTSGLQSLIGVPGVLDERGEPLGESGEPSSRDGLFFVGFSHTLRGHLLEASEAALRLAAHVEAYLASDRSGVKRGSDGGQTGVRPGSDQFPTRIS